MKTITREITTEEIIGYEADDGTRFRDEEECRKYEQSALAAASKAFYSVASKSYSGTEFHDLFYISYEDDMRVVEIRDGNVLQIVNTYLHAKAPRESLVDPRYIGKKCLISFAGYDNIHTVIGSREEMELEFKSYMDALFGTEMEGKNES